MKSVEEGVLKSENCTFADAAYLAEWRKTLAGDLSGLAQALHQQPPCASLATLLE
jgi:hypothetical protein